jgi:3-oxoacyl-[acyl-carrier protein] reductase
MAVIGMTRSLATEMGQYGITANCVSPAYVVTPGQIELGNDVLRDAIVAVQAIKRDGLPEDLAGLVVFLASDRSEFITGQMIHADGGLTYK